MKKIIFLLGVFITLFGGTLLVNAEMNITGVSYEVVSNSLIKIKLIGTLDSSDEYGYFAYFVKVLLMLLIL